MKVDKFLLKKWENVMKKIIVFFSVLVSIGVGSPTLAGTVVGDINENTVQKNVTATDQFTPYQNGNQTDLKDNQNIPENVKDRIYDLSDVKSQTKTGTVTPKDVNPSTNRQK